MRELLLSNPQIAPLKTGQPVWEMAFLYPVQGDWTEREYLALENGRLLVEFDNGHLEFGAMPTREHQRVVLFLYRMLWQFLNVGGIGGELFVAPLPVKLWGKNTGNRMSSTFLPSVSDEPMNNIQKGLTW